MAHARDELVPLLAAAHTVINMPSSSVDTKAILQRLELPKLEAITKLKKDVQFIYYREQSKLLLRVIFPVLGVVSVAMMMYGFYKSIWLPRMSEDEARKAYSDITITGLNESCGRALYMPNVCWDFKIYAGFPGSTCEQQIHKICLGNASAILPADFYCSKIFHYTCDFLLSSWRQCEAAAASVCQQKTAMHDEEAFYFGMGFICFAIAACLILHPILAVLARGRAILYPIDKFRKLSKENQDLLKSDYLALAKQSISLGFPSLEDFANQRITAIRDAIKTEERRIEDDQRVINDLHGVTLYECEKHNLPNDMVKRILFFAEFKRTDADKTDENDKHAVAYAKSVSYKPSCFRFIRRPF